jgi:hypothetical protein
MHTQYQSSPSDPELLLLQLALLPASILRMSPSARHHFRKLLSLQAACIALTTTCHVPHARTIMVELAGRRVPT